MNRFALAAAAVVFSFAAAGHAQNTGTAPGSAPETTPHTAQPARKQAPKPAAQEAPGGGPDKVWINTNSSVYHCPGDRFYGKTAHGRYMTEPAAKAAGAKGVGGKTCFAGK